MKQTKMLLLSLIVGVMMLFGSQAFATQIFFDDFEHGLGQWDSISGQIVSDPAEPDQALNFKELGSGGDAFTSSSMTSLTGHYELSFDYYGAGPIGGDTGGFIGYVESGTKIWLAGTKDYIDPTFGPVVQLEDGNTWRPYTIAFDAGPNIKITAEDFKRSDSIAGNAFFDNIHMENSPNPVPEPATMILLGFGLLGVAGARKKLIRS